ncbi:response regulator transcription factor [Lentzea albidocapillata]|uniref:response regulator transcription factor n=1 Tax=Lentzea albidocapillata TaxID=40571 RepID=UPI00115FB235|nr:response regulator transcription factor [Lentzea albidocapillata]
MAADATPVFREGLRTVVQRTIGLEWAGGTDHPDVIRDGVRTTRPHVVVLDSAIDPRSTLTQELVATNPRLIVAVLFRERDRTPASVRVAQAAGARCLLSRDTDASLMTEAILQTHPAHRYIDPRLVLAFNATPRRRSAGSEHEVLTPRQRQVLALVAEGLSDPDIAQSLDVSVATVRTHARELRHRLGARDRAHAVALAYRTGFLPPRPAPHTTTS